MQHCEEGQFPYFLPAVRQKVRKGDVLRVSSHTRAIAISHLVIDKDLSLVTAPVAQEIDVPPSDSRR